MVSAKTEFPSGISVAGGVVAEGAVMHNTLRIAANVAESETVVIGPDTWEVSLLDDDTTDNTANGDFVPTTNPLNISGYAARYPNSPTAIGALIRVDNEIMELIGYYSSGSLAVFRRGASGTTIATHANAADIFKDTTGVTAGRKALGLNATLTPTAFSAALVWDINNRGSAKVKATSVSANELFIESADAPGGNTAASGDALATTETLAGANNVWSAATMLGGRVNTRLGVANYTVAQNDVDLSRVRIPFPFTVLGFQVEVYDANGLYLEALSDQYIISGNAVILDGTGATNPAAGQFVRVIAWG